MDRSDNQQRKSEGGSYVAGFGIAIGVLIWLQADIANWKAADQLRGSMQVIGSPEDAAQDMPLVFQTGLLTISQTLTDPLHGISLPDVAAVKVTEEQYRRRRRSSSWRTVGTHSAFTPARVGGTELHEDLLRFNGRELWSPLPLPRYDTSRLHTGNGAYISGSTYYTNSRHRYSFKHIPANIEITVVASVTRSSPGSRMARMSPAPAMPQGYPALWTGQLTPEEFLSTLKQRMLTVVLASTGVLTLIGWFLMVIRQNFSSRTTVVPPMLLALASLGSAAASVGIWFVTVNWIIALPAWIGLTIAAYITVTSMFSSREPLT